MRIELNCTVNGVARRAQVYPMARLLDVLREEMRLTGTKEGCGEGECGACSVLVDGELVNSCLFPALQAVGAKITTIEGVVGRTPWSAPGPLARLWLPSFDSAPEKPAGGPAADQGVRPTSEKLHAVQEAFLLHGGAQCGMCTPGMILAAVNLLDRVPHPTEAEIRNGLAGNLCRCTGYIKIFEAVVKACEP
jgi:aerobic carbon-monoxide dehydrogenase small subunit